MGRANHHLLSHCNLSKPLSITAELTKECLILFGVLAEVMQTPESKVWWKCYTVTVYYDESTYPCIVWIAAAVQEGIARKRRTFKHSNMSQVKPEYLSTLSKRIRGSLNLNLFALLKYIASHTEQSIAIHNQLNPPPSSH